MGRACLRESLCFFSTSQRTTQGPNGASIQHFVKIIHVLSKIMKIKGKMRAKEGKEEDLESGQYMQPGRKDIRLSEREQKALSIERLRKGVP